MRLSFLSRRFVFRCCVREETDEVEYERFRSPRRMPEEPLREQLGPIVVRRPALDGLRRVVDDPILGNAIPLIGGRFVTRSWRAEVGERISTARRSRRTTSERRRSSPAGTTSRSGWSTSPGSSLTSTGDGNASPSAC